MGKGKRLRSGGIKICKSCDGQAAGGRKCRRVGLDEAYNQGRRHGDSHDESIPILGGANRRPLVGRLIHAGGMAYGATREAALAAVRSLGLRVVADCIEHGEEVPAQFVQVFSEA